MAFTKIEGKREGTHTHTKKERGGVEAKPDASQEP